MVDKVNLKNHTVKNKRKGASRKDIQYLENIRRFNRFYSRINGVNSEYTDQSAFSVLEAQLLYEIMERGQTSATDLCRFFHLDKGYLSRTLKQMEKKGLVYVTCSPSDRRIRILELSEKGRESTRKLVELSNRIVSEKIRNIPQNALDDMIHAMERIETILSQYD